MTVSAAVWQVVGGARAGGIVVRQEKERTSEEAAERLLAGALVRVLELDAGASRMRYELLSGVGPSSGWVTTKSQGKDLLTPWQGPTKDTTASKKELPAVGHVVKQQDMGIKNASALGVVSYAQWQAKGKVTLNSKKVPKPALEDSGCDAGLVLCTECSLPIGDVAYRSDERLSGHLLHGECQAQLMLRIANQEEKTRKRRDNDLKKARRAENDIGWKVEQVPRNIRCARKMGFAVAPNGMYALTFDEDSNMAHVSPTANPTAALNLEYLALALKVRICDGREPMFSLDPKHALDRAQSAWQVKRFEPAWLAGTSMGEAMFQADVHLKELSMGEYVQPVVGMKSCFDFSEQDGQDVDWNAREWFVVRRAEVQVSEENALIPCVNMGVEAREQIVGANGLEDAILTSKEHPLVRYAEAFEHNFDLIAERKSVVYHLREMAKASVLAKFLVDNEVLIEDPWFCFEVEADESCRPEIPQLWNERCYSQIEVRDGKIVDAEQGISAKKHGLYGGVEMGLPLAMVPGAPLRRGPPLTMAAGQISRAPTASGLLASGQEGFSYASAIAAAAVPRGVDLNLDGFDLSSAKQGSANAGTFATGVSFFRSLDGMAEDFSVEDAGFLRSLFNPVLSDRRMEGELFTPPDSTPAYLDRLRALVAEEQTLCKQQRDCFLSQSFEKDAPGPLFPSSWVPSNGIANGQVARQLREVKDYGGKLQRRLKAMTPVFSKAAEDGTKFRIYQLGNLEVRTVQLHNGEEEVRKVFSSRTSAAETSLDVAGIRDERITRATQYVESSQQTKSSKQLPSDVRFYVVLETSGGDAVLTEKVGQQITFVRNPEDLEARNSLAKVTRSAECGVSRVTVGAAKDKQEAELGRYGDSLADRARYAEEVYSLAVA